MSDNVSTVELFQRSLATLATWTSKLSLGKINKQQHRQVDASNAIDIKEPIPDILFRLPRELRDMIYDIVYTPEHEDATFQFATARSAAPSISLLLSDRRIHREAKAAYETSCAAFWANNIFVLPPELTYDTCGITAKEIQHMKRIRLNTDKLCLAPKGEALAVVSSGWLSLEATDGDLPGWSVSEEQIGEILGSNTAGFMRWMKLMSCLARKADKRCAMEMKKRRLDEIISALWRLAASMPDVGEAYMGEWL